MGHALRGFDCADRSLRQYPGLTGKGAMFSCQGPTRMLAIPLKSSASMGLSAPLRVYIANEYSKDDLEAVDTDLKSLERMRSMALQARAATDTSVQTLQSYYAQLNNMETLFPINPDAVRLMFSWSDAFRPTKKISEVDVRLEKAGILFNIGSVKSNIAASADRLTAEGLAIAGKEFQVAAGVFKYLRETITSQLTFALSSDLTNEGLNMIESLMLGQAQACFCERAISDRAKSNMKASLIAKLAQQASAYYLTALRFAESAVMTGAGLDSSWPATLRFQHDMYGATAQFYQAEAAKDAAMEAGSGYGEEIARLRAAGTLIDRVLEAAGKLKMGPAIITKVDQLKAKIIKSRASAEKDNNAIYLETVPPEGSLKPIAVASMVKYIPFEAGVTTEAPLFANILPKPVKEALTSFEKQAADVASAAESECREASKAARSQLAAVGLPGSLESHESPGGLPEVTWKKMQALREKGSTPDELLGQASELQTLAGKVAEVFLKIEKCMKDEEGKDETFRSKYGEAWAKVGATSASIFQESWKELQHFQGLYSQAAKSDAFLLSRLQDPDFQSLTELLSTSRQELNARLAKPKAATDAPTVDTSGLRSAMLELMGLIQERDAIVTQIRQDGSQLKTTVKERLMSSDHSTPNEAIVSGFVSRLSEKKKGITGSIQRQQPILAAILAENEKFQAARHADRAMLERDGLIQKIENGVVRCHELHAQLTEGKDFYSSVHKRLQQLLLIVEDKVYGQDLQRRDFEVELNHAQQRVTQESADSEAARRLFEQLNMQDGRAPSSTAPPPPSYSAAVPSPGRAPGTAPPPPYSAAPPQYPGPGYNAPAPPPSYNPAYYTGQPVYYQPSPPAPHHVPPPPSYPGAPPQGGHMGPPPAYYDPRVSGPGAPPASGTTEAGKVRQLMDMGFPEADARRALSANNGDVNLALTSLLAR